MRSVEEAIAYVIVKERKFVPTSTEDDVLKFTSVSVLLGSVCVLPSLFFRRGLCSELTTSSTGIAVSLASNKALLFDENFFTPTVMSSRSSDGFVKRFTQMELSKLDSILSCVLEKFSLAVSIFLQSVSFRPEQCRQIIADFSSITSPRRSSRFRPVLVLSDPENNLLRKAAFSTDPPHCKQIFSGTATRTKHFVGVFSSAKSSERRIDYILKARK